jgi:FeS assembly SUF system regulator
MLRISRLTDYGTLLLVYLASQNDRLCTAGEMSSATHVALPTAQKLLKLLAKGGLVDSVRGVDGGYTLARPPKRISATQILDVLEGPLAITECSTADSQCELESMCQVGSAWQKINHAIRSTLDDISLAELGHAPARTRQVEISVPADAVRYRSDYSD